MSDSKPQLLSFLHRTGRTTRLIEEAMRLTREGKKVIMVFHTEQDLTTAHYACMCLVKAIVPNKNGADWDWNEMRLYGEPLETVYLIDHLVIETKFAKQLRYLHQFDPLIMRLQ